MIVPKEMNLLLSDNAFFLLWYSCFSICLWFIQHRHKGNVGPIVLASVSRRGTTCTTNDNSKSEVYELKNSTTGLFSEIVYMYFFFLFLLTQRYKKDNFVIFKKNDFIFSKSPFCWFYQFKLDENIKYKIIQVPKIIKTS